MNSLEITPHGVRRARVRSLILVGALTEKSGLLDAFDIIVGEDLQKSPSMKEPVAALFKGFLVLKDMVHSGEINKELYAQQGLQALGETNRRKREKG